MAGERRDFTTRDGMSLSYAEAGSGPKFNDRFARFIG